MRSGPRGCGRGGTILVAEGGELETGSGDGGSGDGVVEAGRPAFGAGVAARTRIQYIVRSVSFCAFSAAAEAAADGATTWAIVAVLAAAPASIRTQRVMILKSGMAVVLR